MVSVNVIFSRGSNCPSYHNFYTILPNGVLFDEKAHNSRMFVDSL